MADDRDAIPAFCNTAEAARHLGVDRAWLDAIAPGIAERRPDLIVRVGFGRVRRHYRWRLETLAEAINLGDLAPAPRPAPTPASRKPRRRLRQLLPR